MPSRTRPLSIAGGRTRTKPRFGQARIDRGHPLARYLNAFFLFNEGEGLTVYDLVNPARKGTMGSGFLWGRGPFGVHVVSPNTSLRSIQVSPGITTVGAGTGWTVELAIAMVATPGVVGSVANSTTTQDQLQVTSTNHLSILDPSSGNAADTTAMTNGTWYHQVAMNVTSSTASFFREGIANGSGGASFSNSPVTFSELLGSTANASQQLSAKVAYIRIWNIPLSQAQASLLHEDPYALLVPVTERTRTIAIMGGGGGSTIVSGSATLISNSAIVESAQIVEPSTVQANSAIVESAQVVAPSGGVVEQSNSAVVEAAQIVEASGGVVEQSNSAVVVSSAQVLEKATEQANTAIVEFAQILEPSTEQSNSGITEGGQVVSPAVEQSNSALALPTAQIVAPVVLQANSALVVTGGLAGVGGGTLTSNSALIVSAQVVAPATLAANTALVVSVRVIASVILSASSTILEAAQLRATALLSASSALVVTGSSVTPGGATVYGVVRISDSAVHALAIGDSAVHALAIGDSAVHALAIGDSAVQTVTVGDLPA